MGWNPLSAVGDFFESLISWAVDIPEGVGGIQVNQTTRNAPIPIIYGRDRFDAANWAYWSVSGTDNRYLYVWAGFCEGEIDGFEQIWVDDKPLAEWVGVNRSTYPNFNPWDGDTRVIIREYLGADSQTSDALLQAADPRWTAQHRLQGIAGLVLRFRYDDSWFAGVPKISAVVRGRKVLLANNIDVGWTQNAALILRDYMTNTRFGKGLDYASDFGQSWAQAFIDCEDTETFFTSTSLGTPDEVLEVHGERYLRWDARPGNGVALAGAVVSGDVSGAQASALTAFMSNGWYGNTGGYYLPYDPALGAFDPTDNITIQETSGKLFSFNGALNNSQEFETLLENVKRIKAVMRGNMPMVQGKWELYVEKGRAPVTTLLESEVIGGIDWGAPSQEDKFNRVTLTYLNPATEWKKDIAVWPPPGSPEEAQFLAEDNEKELHRELEIEGVRNAYQAADIARILCLKSRDALQFSVTVDARFLEYSCGQVIAMNWSGLGWTDKPFMIVQRGLTGDGNVNLRLEEHTAAIYGSEPFDLDIIKDNTDLPDPFYVPVPQNLAAVTYGDIAEGGVLTVGLSVTWDAVDDETVQEYELQWRNDGVTGWPNPSIMTRDPRADVELLWGRPYDIRVRAINTALVKSEWSDVLLGFVFVDVTAPTPPNILGITPGPGRLVVATERPPEVDFKDFGVYYSQVNTFPGGSPQFRNGATEIPVENLTPDAPWFVWLTSFDDVGNESAPSTAAQGTPTEPEGPPYVEGDTEPDPAGLDEGTYWWNRSTGEVKTLRSGVWVDEAPEAPTNLRLTNPDPADPAKFQGRESKFDWKGPAGTETLPFYWFDIEVWPSYPRDTPARKLRSEDRGGPASARFFQWTFQDAIDADPDGTAEAPTIKDGWRTFEVRVYSMWPDEVTRSATYASLTVTNEQLQQITGFVATVEDRSIQIAHAPIPGSDFAGIEVHSSTSPGYTPDETTLRGVIYAGGDYQEIRGLIPGTGLRYLSLLGFDVWGRERALMTKSAEQAVTLPANFGGLAYKGSVGSGDIQNNAVIRAKVPAGELIETTYVEFATVSENSPAGGAATLVLDYTFTAVGDGVITFKSFATPGIDRASDNDNPSAACRVVMSMSVNGGAFDAVGINGRTGAWINRTGPSDTDYEWNSVCLGSSEYSLYGGPAPAAGSTVTIRTEFEFSWDVAVTPNYIIVFFPFLEVNEYNNT